MNKQTLKNIGLALVVAVALFNYLQDAQQGNPAPSDSALAGEEQVLAAYSQSRSDVQVQGSGTVFKILSDDNKGSRHQRILVRVPSGLQLLIAHNIDLAPRIDALREGDTLEFYGEYEYNKKGGVVHWTHHDPRGRHEGGWLRHNGKIYQ